MAQSYRLTNNHVYNVYLDADLVIVTMQRIVFNAIKVLY